MVKKFINAAALLLARVVLTSAAPASTDWWHPTPNTTWEIILSVPLTPSITSRITASTIDLDLYDTPPDTIAALRSSGKRIICYFSAGSYEEWRADAAQFTPADRGNPLAGWEGEWWIDTRSENVRGIMAKRLDLAKDKGCDAVDPDNVDVFDNDNGLGLTKEDAVAYVKWLAEEGHKRGMAVGLKNAASIVQDVVSVVDFEVNESCGLWQECGMFRKFLDEEKPVFAIEYPSDAPDLAEGTLKRICGEKERKGMSTLLKKMDLGEWSLACPN